MPPRVLASGPKPCGGKNKFSTPIPIKPLGLVVHGLCFLGVNVSRFCNRVYLLPCTEEHSVSDRVYQSAQMGSIVRRRKLTRGETAETIR